jgi:hypothetical protein
VVATCKDNSRGRRVGYALRRGLGFWALTFEGRQAIFKHELGALYVACLLLDSPPEPLHAVALALALKAREKFAGQAFEPTPVKPSQPSAGRHCLRAFLEG